MTSAMITFEYQGNGVAFDPDVQMWNLNAMHQAAGGKESKAPSKWLRNLQTQELIEALATEETGQIPPSISVLKETVSQDHSFIETREGRNGGTWAHWQIAAAYAHYLDARFYLQWNRWAMERAQQVATGDGAAPVARVVALEERVAVLEGRGAGKRDNGPRRLMNGAPRMPFIVTVGEITQALRDLGGSADLYQLRLALPYIGYNALRGYLYRMVARNLVQRPYEGHYALP